MTISKHYKQLLILVLLILVQGCGSDSSSGGMDNLNTDIPPDPDVSPPPIAEGPLSPSVTLGELDPGNSARVSLVIGGVGYRDSTEAEKPSTFQIVQYTENNLTIVEDGIVKGKIIMEGSGLKADIAFVIDNTGSMGGEIDGVRESILRFIDALRNGGQDVQGGVVAFNDALAEDFPNDVPPADTRADPAVYGFWDLTNDFSQTGDLYSFIEALPAQDPGRNFDFPELAFAGVDFARREFSWREEAQRIYILITDDSAWGQGYSRQNNDKGIDEEYFTDESLGMLLREDGSVVHVYSPAPKPEDRLQPGEYNVKPLADLTGGIWNELDRRGKFDLLELNIIEITLATSLVEFVKNGNPGAVQERLLRVIVSVEDDGRIIDGEREVELSY